MSEPGGGPTAGPVDVAIVGGGIIGLATAWRLLQARPDLRLVVLEKEDELAAHQSGHNSGVVHAGLYYAPGSLKARLCREGREELERFCRERGIRLERTGKLVVAVDPAELPRLEALRDRATANGVEVETVGPERIREIEPHVVGLRALWSPTTGIVDFREVTLALADAVRAAGGAVETSRAVTGVDERPGELIIATGAGPLVTGSLIACAGLWADRVASLTGAGGADAPRIVPFRGDYHTLRPEASHFVRGLIYPVPDPRLPFLGIHLTRRIDGLVLAGPNAVLALAREGYRRRDVSLRDLATVLTDPGFLRLARRHLRAGLVEAWRDVSARAFLGAVQRYLPELRADQLRFGPSGVRAQAVARDGTLLDDFDLAGDARVLHVRNAPSPGATASLAIGRVLAERALARFDLRAPPGRGRSGAAKFAP